MKRATSSQYKFGERGFAHHLLMPMLAIAAVAVIGGLVAVAVNHAQTLPCTSQTLQSGSKDSGSSHCVQYIQQMENGLTADNALVAYGTTRINSAPIGALSSTSAGFLVINNSFGTTSNMYDASTKSAIAHTQSWTNTATLAGIQEYVSKSMTVASFHSTVNPSGNLRTDGVTDKGTWYAMCRYATLIPSSAEAVTNSTDYTGGKPNSSGSNKTNAWYIRSYIRAASTAASDAGCKALLSGSTTTTSKTTTIPAAPTGVKYATTASTLTVSWNAVSGTQYYQVEPLNASGAAVLTPSKIDSGTLSASYSVATVGSSGYVEVRDCNASSVCSAWTKIPFKFASSTASSESKTSVPSVPTSIHPSINASSGQLTVTWSEPSNNATSYNIHLLNSKSALAPHTATVAVTAAVFSKGTAAPFNETVVQACNSAGCSLWSLPVTY